jgi:hypothetical protein
MSFSFFISLANKCASVHFVIALFGRSQKQKRPLRALCFQEKTQRQEALKANTLLGKA